MHSSDCFDQSPHAAKLLAGQRIPGPDPTPVLPATDTWSMHSTDADLAAAVAKEAGELLLAVREQIGFYDPYYLGDEGTGDPTH